MRRRNQQLRRHPWRGLAPGTVCHWSQCVALSALVVVTLEANPAVQPAPTQPAGQPETADVVEPPPVEVYAYDRDGRRDPFVSPFAGGTGIRPPTERPPGLAGLSINDLSLRGIVVSAGEHLAIMQAPDNRTYILYGDEQLFDAVVKTITDEGVVFLQQVNDPLSLVAEREVLRTLRGPEEGR